MEVDENGPVLADAELSQRQLEAATNDIRELRVQGQRQQKAVSDEQTEARLKYETLSREQAIKYDEMTKKFESDKREQELKSLEIKKERDRAERERIEAHARHLQEQSDARSMIEAYEEEIKMLRKQARDT